MNDQLGFDLVSSPASVLKESLRGGGSLMPTAIANQIGHSISANASMLQIRSPWNGRDFVITRLNDEQILDCGEPVNAERSGWGIPLDERLVPDLGRFDLGFDMARIHQCMTFPPLLLHCIKSCILKAWI
ncbi:MAG: hypothetical protein HQL91_10110 [Magnetococcales bacterium]|nr:hypothetical protein [Magnetococcales bacterium]